MNEKGRDTLVALIAIVSCCLIALLFLRFLPVGDWIEKFRSASPFGNSAQDSKANSPNLPDLTPVYVPPTSRHEYQGNVLPNGAVPAVPKTDLWLLVTPDDYPSAALRNNWEGRVSISWTIDVEGRPRDCVVEKGSGHKVLDETTCRLVMRRMRYSPATTSQGFPIESRDGHTWLWRLPG